MCGIAGALGVASIDMVASMSDAIAHRGPDDSGAFFDSATGVALGHRRLSIIDVSACGHQPMSYADGRYQIVFNGEIYNFQLLRDELSALGHHFVSRSDTEVVLAAYAEWGEQCVERLRGMFAFAIFDRAARQSGDTLLFLARDRFGIKPLYYTSCDGVFAFASELKALLASGIVERTLDLDSLWQYLSLGSVPQPGTALRDVKSLEAAHTMKVHPDRSIECRRYWDLAVASETWIDEVRGLDRQTAPLRLRKLLEDATRLHMIADVPVGAFLSGGIDSTAVVGLMTRASGHRIRTFSVGFADDQTVIDERRWARLAADMFDSEHTEVVISGQEVADRFDDLVAAIDQPSLDGTNTFIVSRAASQSMKVALSGLGGDELFAGYPHFRRLHRARTWDRWLGQSPDSIRKRMARLVPGRFLVDRDFLTSALGDRYATLRLLADDRTKKDMLNPDVAARLSQTALPAMYAPLLRSGLDDVAQTTYIEIRRYLADTLLRDADAMSMFWSLEVRPVLLDHVLAEFAFALPSTLKLNDRENNRENKPLLVDAVRDLLPPGLLTREKTGFELPLQSWLTGPLRDRARDAFSSETAKSIFDGPFLALTLDGLAKRCRPPLGIWSLLILIEWMRRYAVTP
ncbi:MAG: asparagine synthase (glutamine-hydrolyzing) [Acidobacteriota bacterium]